MRRALVLLALAFNLEAQDAKPKVTFTKDIAPLVFRHCAECHRPDEVGPFSLLTYADVKKRAGQILTFVESRQMPPWKPMAGFGDFISERRVPDSEIALLKAWVDLGAPEGDARDLPPPPKFLDGWAFGEPDLIVTMPEPYTLRAEGRDLLRNFVLPLDFPEDRYIRAYQYRPSNRRIVHHAVLFLDTTGGCRKKDKQDGEPGYTGMPVGAEALTGGILGGWAPGFALYPFPEGTAKEAKRGADLVLQVHFSSSGKVEKEQSRIGLWLAKKPPERKLDVVFMTDTRLAIPAGMNAASVTDAATLPVDMEITAVFPHSHYLGKECRVIANTPDGREIPIVWIKNWDFKWQQTYRYREPLRLPKGTVITMHWVFDNSDENPRNPSHPPRDVRYGETTMDEMATTFWEIANSRPEDTFKLRAAFALFRRVKNK